MQFFKSTFLLLAVSATAFAAVSDVYPYWDGSIQDRLANKTLRPQCTIDGTDPNCCWGGKDGSDACSRQNGGAGCVLGAEWGNFCKNRGIPYSKCVGVPSNRFGPPCHFLTRTSYQSADCCDTRTGKGKGCPKGKNRCDPDSGCGADN